MAINCGVIAAHILRGLAQPSEIRHRIFSVNVAEFMKHRLTLSSNDAISHVTCRQWRFQHALRLLDWAVAQLRDDRARVAQVLTMDVND